MIIGTSFTLFAESLREFVTTLFETIKTSEEMSDEKIDRSQTNDDLPTEHGGI